MHRPDDSRPPLLEVAQWWNDACLDVRHFRPGARPVTIGGGHPAGARFLGLPRARLPDRIAGFLPAALPGPFAALATPTSDFHAPDDALPSGEDRDLVKFEGGEWILTVEPGWGLAARLDGEPVDAEALRAAGRLEESVAARRIRVDRDLSVDVTVGGARFTVALADADRARRPGALVGLGGAVVAEALFLGLLGLFAFVGALVGLLVALLPGSPEASGYTLDDRFTRILATVEEPTPEPDPAPRVTNREEGAAAKRAEGKTGKPDGPLDRAKGKREDLDRQRADRELAENAGVLGALRADGFSEGEVVSAAALDGIGGIIGAKGVQRGTGLGSRGASFGGGGPAEGIGGLGTRGPGTGDGRYGAQGGDFGRKTEGFVASPTGEPITIGGLDRAQVDEVVKRHLTQIRYCYQRELQRSPQISGKVSIRFTVAADGTVSSARAHASQLGSAAVEDCIVGRFLRMQFPEPRGGGMVIVTYPFLFSPG